MADTSPTLNVIARAPFHVYYEGPAISLTATNKVGVFDILPGHADFFSMLTPCTVTIEAPDQEVSFEIYSILAYVFLHIRLQLRG
jgi:F0F1-type ATP synthase epsilon subunit